LLRKEVIREILRCGCFQYFTIANNFFALNFIFNYVLIQTMNIHFSGK